MSLSLQHQIKNNSTDIRSYIEDLYKWEDQKKEKPKATIQKTKNIEIPIRGKVESKAEEINNENASPNKKESADAKLKRDGNTVSDYYKAWDKFDVEKALEEEGQPLKLNPETKQKEITSIINNKNPNVPPKTQIIIKGGRNTTVTSNIDSLKEKGNLHYRNAEFEQALGIYTECIEKMEFSNKSSEICQAIATIYSNRAMTYIKLNDYIKAEKDCSTSIELHGNLAKSFHRRGVCRKKLGKYKLALNDFKKANEIEPDNSEITHEITTINHTIQKKIEQTRNNLIMKSRSFNSESIPLTTIDSSHTASASFSQTIQYTQESSKLPEPKHIKEEVRSNFEESTKFLHMKQIDKPAIQKKEGELKKEEEEVKNEDDLEEGKKVKFIWIEKVEEDRKREAFDPTKKAKKSILKKNHKEKLDGKDEKMEEAKKKVDLAQIIEDSKKTYTEKFFKEENKVINSAQFLKIWMEIKKNKEAAWNFLQRFNFDEMPQIFKESLEVETFMEILEVINLKMDGNEIKVKEFLFKIAKIRRFGITVSCLIGKEKKIIKETIEKLMETNFIGNDEKEDLFRIYKF